MQTYNVPEMSCGHCVGVIEKAIKNIDGQANVSADLGSKQIIVETRADEAAVAEAIRSAGYENEKAG